MQIVPPVGAERRVSNGAGSMYHHMYIMATCTCDDEKDMGLVGAVRRCIRSSRTMQIRHSVGRHKGQQPVYSGCHVRQVGVVQLLR